MGVGLMLLISLSLRYWDSFSPSIVPNQVLKYRGKSNRRIVGTTTRNNNTKEQKSLLLWIFYHNVFQTFTSTAVITSTYILYVIIAKYFSYYYLDNYF